MTADQRVTKSVTPRGVEHVIPSISGITVTPRDQVCDAERR